MTPRLHSTKKQNFQILLVICVLVIFRTSSGFISHDLRRTPASRISLSFAFQNKRQSRRRRVLLHETNSPGESDKATEEDDKEKLLQDVEEMFQEEEEQVEIRRTLYEVLEAPATATRAELKQKYVELAKMSHPDAQIGNKQNNKIDFNEIAAAWRILGDPKERKRYDRELRAQAFADTAERALNENLERAYPAVANMIDKVANPFLRRTTATTWAVGQAVAKNVDSGRGITDAWQSAMEASQDAGRKIDSMELAEKSEQLEERAQKHLERGREIELELEMLTERRLLATLQSEDFFLSSDEANDVLNRLDIARSQSIMDRAMLRNTIEQDIQSLQVAEAKFSEKLAHYEDTDKEWSNLLKEQDDAKISLSKRKMQEIEARKALELAQRQVAEAKEQLEISTNALRGIEQRVRKSAFEMDRATTMLSKKQEKVRNALKKKADLIKGGIQVEYLSEEELTSLRRKEIQLLGERKQVARMATRLQSRAEKLKNEAEGLEGGQNGLNGQ